jgi:SAM-dependent methyltransferase
MTEAITAARVGEGVPVLELEGEHGDAAACVDWFLRAALPTSARVLDVGCRYGSFLANLQARGWRDVAGVDVDAAAVDRGLAAWPDLAGSLRAYDGAALPFADATFDVVTMFDVIEHIPDPGVFLQEVRRTLRPGGVFIFQTPNLLIDAPYWILALRLFTKERRKILWREHCSLQTLGSLRCLLADAGFSDVRIEGMRVDTDFKKAAIRQALGPVGPLLLTLANRLPLPLTPNFWGTARRK